MVGRSPATTFKRNKDPDNENKPFTTSEGNPVYTQDVVNNPVDKLFNDWEKITGKVIDLSGANRSKKSKESKLNHFEDNARDVSTLKLHNPWMHDDADNPGQAKRDLDLLIKMAFERGIRIADGNGHLHFDAFEPGSRSGADGKGKKRGKSLAVNEKNFISPMLTRMRKILKEVEKPGSIAEVKDMQQARLKDIDAEKKAADIKTADETLNGIKGQLF